MGNKLKPSGDVREKRAKIVNFGAGEHIAQSAEKLVAAAKDNGAANGVFNEIELTATAVSTSDSIVNFYNQESKRRAEAYRNSPEGKEAERQRGISRSNAQQLHDTLMAQLPQLDMSDDVAVLDWLCQMQEPSDHNGVIVRRETIVSVFEKHGFRADENCGADYRPGDRKNMHRYLVGQALSGLKDGPAIHPILHKFANEWRAQFGIDRAALTSKSGEKNA